jgi:FKBP-type peptidyl-prolyl cis-trans isomerase FkpA
MTYNKIFLLLILCPGFFFKGIAQDFQVKDGLRYKMYTAHTGAKPKAGESVIVDMLFYGDHDSLIYNSTDKNQPVTIPIGKPQFKGDLMQGLQMMSEGDSAVFLVSGDSIAKITGQANNIRPGSFLKYIIKLRSIYSPASQQKKDEETIAAYLKKNKIRGAKHTASGLYYKIIQPGTGPTPQEGQSVATHYTGKLLDGTVFDSDKGGGFSFIIGKHNVIPGWEEGFALLNKGTKATLYLPSTIAYGVQGAGPIPPNSVLIFDVEVVDVK